MKKVIAFDSATLTNKEITILLQSIINFKGFKCTIKPFDIDARKTENKFHIAAIAEGERVELTLLSFNNLRGYHDDGYNVVIVGDYIEFLNNCANELKYFK